MLLVAPEQIQAYTTAGYWGTDTLDDLFRRNAAATPHSVALVDPPNRAELTVGQPQRFTYAELAEQVDRLASSLLKLGLTKDDVIMVQLPNIVELPIVYLAAARLGLIVSPLPVQYRTHELRQTLNVAPKAFITTNHFGGFNATSRWCSICNPKCPASTIIALGDDLPVDVIAWTDLVAAPADYPGLAIQRAAYPITANEVFTICWTSGTEAEPKGVPRSHNHWISIAYATTTDGAQIERGDTLLNPFPMVNMSAIGGMLVPWLLTGGKLVMHHPLNLGLFLGQIKEMRARQLHRCAASAVEHAAAQSRHPR
ncbi:MAG: class I adenylate-forming enzyme family protein [Anaerolineae bacterium]